MLDSAENRIWIELYIWTAWDRVQNALLEAKNRGVDIQVILEPNVYGNPHVNNAMIAFLEEQDIPLFFSDPERYRFTHDKFWIVDNEYCISTGNWTKSMFSKNREYIACGNDTSVLDTLAFIFESDSQKLAVQDTHITSPHMAVSPVSGRRRITNFITETQTELLVYNQTIQDPLVLAELQALHDKGIHVVLCTSDSESNISTRNEYPDLDWRIQKTPYMHAKVMIRDGIYGYIGSHNFTTNSIDNNREIGLFLELSQEQRKIILQDMEK